MGTVLFYNDSDGFDPDNKHLEFDTEEEMLKFVNDNKIGDKIIAAYHIIKEIKFKPVEQVVTWEIDYKN